MPEKRYEYVAWRKSRTVTAKLDQPKLLNIAVFGVALGWCKNYFSLLRLHSGEVLSSKKQRQGRSECTTIYMCAYGLEA